MIRRSSDLDNFGDYNAHSETDGLERFRFAKVIEGC